MSATGRSLRLRVGDATLGDIAEGRARLSRHLLEALALEEGDVVRIEGERPILARAAAADPEDDGLDLIRLDGTQRRRLGVETGEDVDVRRYEVPVASRVRVVTLGTLGPRDVPVDAIRRVLAEQPILAGDSVTAGPRRTRFDARLDVLGLTLAEFVGGSTECGALLVRVVDTAPRGIVRVTDDTLIDVDAPASARDEAGLEADDEEADARAARGERA